MKGYKQLGIVTLTAGSILLTSAGQAADLTASSDAPSIFFTDTTGTDTTPFTIFSEGGNGLAIADNIGGNTHNIIDMQGTASSTANSNSLVVNANGDIGLANDTVVIDRTTGAMGIGTSPTTSGTERKLHLKSTTGFAGIVQEGNGSTWLMDNGLEGKWFTKLTNDASGVEEAGILKLQNTAGTNSIVATDVGVGIGTDTPAAKLEVTGDIKSSFDGDSSKNLQTLFRMSANNTDSGKNSDAGFVVENTRENFSYAFRTLEKFTRPGETTEINGGFAISKQATGEQELVLINPTSNDPTKVELHLSSGASNVAGQWENASSRSYKKNIHELSGEDAMQAMRGLTSVTYQFKQDKGNNKMIGFIAEDIPELLATRTRKTVDSLRIVAVLTKAIQEQDKALTSKDKKIAEMEAKAENNSSRLEKLEAQLIKLMMK